MPRLSAQWEHGVDSLFLPGPAHNQGPTRTSWQPWGQGRVQTFRPIGHCTRGPGLCFLHHSPLGGSPLPCSLSYSPLLLFSLPRGAVSLAATHTSFSAFLEADTTMSALWSDILYPSPLGTGGEGGGGSAGTPFTCSAPTAEQEGSCLAWVDRCCPRCVWVYLVGRGSGVERAVP